MLTVEETRAGKRTARARGEGRGREISPLRSEYTLYTHTYFIDFLPKEAVQRQHMRRTMRKSRRSVSLATNEAGLISFQLIFTVKSLEQDVLCITVFYRDLFSPNGKFVFIWNDIFACKI